MGITIKGSESQRFLIAYIGLFPREGHRSFRFIHGQIMTILL